MKEKYEVDNKLIQEKTEYDKEKLEKKLKLVRNEFTTVGKYEMPLIKKQEIDLDEIRFCKGLICGAVTGIRTRDLHLTKVVLYLLSHNSMLGFKPLY